jgi:hypothetical protein
MIRARRCSTRRFDLGFWLVPVIVVANVLIAHVSYHDHETAGSRGTEGAREACRQRPSGYGERPEANRRVIPLRALSGNDQSPRKS